MEDIVVKGKFMNLHEMDVFDGWQMRSTLEADFSRYLGYGGLAIAGATGGLLGAGIAGVGATAWSDVWESRDDAIRHVTNEYYLADAADGTLNGQAGGPQLFPMP